MKVKKRLRLIKDSREWGQMHDAVCMICTMILMELQMQRVQPLDKFGINYLYCGKE